MYCSKQGKLLKTYSDLDLDPTMLNIKLLRATMYSNFMFLDRFLDELSCKNTHTQRERERERERETERDRETERERKRERERERERDSDECSQKHNNNYDVNSIIGDDRLAVIVYLCMQSRMLGNHNPGEQITNLTRRGFFRKNSCGFIFSKLCYTRIFLIHVQYLFH